MGKVFLRERIPYPKAVRAEVPGAPQEIEVIIFNHVKVSSVNRWWSDIRREAHSLGQTKHKNIYIQWTFEQHWLELCRSIYMQTFSVVNTVVVYDPPVGWIHGYGILGIGEPHIWKADYQVIHRFLTVGRVSTPNPCAVQGSTGYYIYLQRCNSLSFEMKFYIELSL